MSKQTKSKIRIPIYERTIILNITKKISKEVKKIDEDQVGIGEVWGVVIEDKDGFINIIIHPKSNINTICHEAFHVTSRVLGEAGLELDGGSEEAYAYLIGWLVERIEKKLKKHNK